MTGTDSDTGSATSLDDTPTGLTFVLDEGMSYAELAFWYQADGDTTWTQYDSHTTNVSGNYVSLLTSHFSSTP